MEQIPQGFEKELLGTVCIGEVLDELTKRGLSLMTDGVEVSAPAVMISRINRRPAWLWSLGSSLHVVSLEANPSSKTVSQSDLSITAMTFARLRAT